MEKNHKKLVKRITVDELAAMMERGFEKLPTRDQVVELVREIRTEVKNDIKDLVHRDEFEKLKTRVGRVETVMNIPK